MMSGQVDLGLSVGFKYVPGYVVTSIATPDWVTPLNRIFLLHTFCVALRLLCATLRFLALFNLNETGIPEGNLLLNRFSESCVPSCLSSDPLLLVPF